MKFENDAYIGKRGTYQFYYVALMDAVIAVFYSNENEDIEEIIGVCHGTIEDEYVHESLLDDIKRFEKEPFFGVGSMKYNI